MTLDLQTREWIASDLAAITQIHALDVLQDRKSDAFVSLYQQACAVRRCAQRRQRIIAEDLKGMNGLDPFDGEWHVERIQNWIDELSISIDDGLLG